jgi:hypothetical protein
MIQRETLGRGGKYQCQQSNTKNAALAVKRYQISLNHRHVEKKSHSSGDSRP